MDGKLDCSAGRHGLPLPGICFPLFRFVPLRTARLYLTAMGTYDAALNGTALGDGVLSPGFTAYAHRHQNPTYDLTQRCRSENTLRIEGQERPLSPGRYLFWGTR